MDCSPPGSSVHGISQARILERVAISFSRGSSRPRDPSLLHWQVCSLPLSHQGSPKEPSRSLEFIQWFSSLLCHCFSIWDSSYESHYCNVTLFLQVAQCVFYRFYQLLLYSNEVLRQMLGVWEPFNVMRNMTWLPLCIFYPPTQKVESVGWDIKVSRWPPAVTHLPALTYFGWVQSICSLRKLIWGKWL